MIRLSIDNSAIIDAWLIVLHRNKQQDKRPLRMLMNSDLTTIHSLRTDFSRLYNSEKSSLTYKQQRNKFLDQKAIEENWSPETRNLYGSILSTVTNWSKNGGRDQKSLAELPAIWVGAKLLLQFSDLPIQHQLKL